MNILVGGNKHSLHESQSNKEKEFHIEIKQPFTGIGKFELIEIPEDKVSEFSLQLKGENFSHQYYIKKLGNRYFVV